MEGPWGGRSDQGTQLKSSRGWSMWMGSHLAARGHSPPNTSLWALAQPDTKQRGRRRPPGSRPQMMGHKRRWVQDGHILGTVPSAQLSQPP